MTRCTCGGTMMQTRKKQRLPRLTPAGTLIVEYTLYDCDTCGTTRMLDPVMVIPLPVEWQEPQPEALQHGNRQ